MGHGDQIISRDLVGPLPYTVHNVFCLNAKLSIYYLHVPIRRLWGLWQLQPEDYSFLLSLSTYTYSTAADTVLQPEVPAATQIAPLAHAVLRS